MQTIKDLENSVMQKGEIYNATLKTRRRFQIGHYVQVKGIVWLGDKPIVLKDWTKGTIKEVLESGARMIELDTTKEIPYEGITIEAHPSGYMKGAKHSWA